MYKAIKYIAIILFLFEFVSCNDPISTELVPINGKTDNLDVQVLSPEPNEFVYNNGYDTTGVTDVLPRKSNYIILSGIKYSFNNTVFETGTANAIFFDLAKSIRNHRGRTVGFRSRYIGRIKFDNDTARVVFARMKLLNAGVQTDTLIGLKYILRYRDKFHPNRRPFPYDSNVNVNIIPIMGRPINFNLPVPQEITGSVKVIGKRSERNIELVLNWNAGRSGKIEIILGGIPKGKKGVFPLLKFRTKDNGFLRIPSRYIEPIPFDRFDKIVLTFIRKFEKKITNNNSLNDNFIAAQSIHNIIFEVQ